MQNNTDDELIDYNELEEENVNGSGQHTSRSSVPTPPSLKSDEDSDEVDSDLEKGQDTNMDSTSTQQALVERRQKEFDILTSKLEENEWKLRLKVFEDPLQSNLAISMNASTRTLAEILQFVPPEDAEQISEFRGAVYMPLYFLEKCSSDSEKNLISEQNNFSTVETVHLNKSSDILETPD